MKKNTPNISMLSSLTVFFLCNLACHIRILEVWVVGYKLSENENFKIHKNISENQSEIPFCFTETIGVTL